MDAEDGQRPVERATRAELRALKMSVQSNALAATMVSLARQIDYARGAASAAMAAAQLRETRRVLMDEASEHAAGDTVDDINSERAVLRVVEGSSTAEDLDGSAVAAKRRRSGKTSGGHGGPAS